MEKLSTYRSSLLFFIYTIFACPIYAEKEFSRESNNSTSGGIIGAADFMLLSPPELDNALDAHVGELWALDSNSNPVNFGVGTIFSDEKNLHLITATHIIYDHVTLLRRANSIVWRNELTQRVEIFDISELPNSIRQWRFEDDVTIINKPNNSHQDSTNTIFSTLNQYHEVLSEGYDSIASIGYIRIDNEFKRVYQSNFQLKQQYRVRDPLFATDLDGAPGLSGAPIFIMREGKNYLAAIYIGSSKNIQCHTLSSWCRNLARSVTLEDLKLSIAIE